MRKLLLIICFGTSINLAGQDKLTVLFAFDKSQLTNEARSVLDDLVLKVKTSSTIVSLKLTGHCDAIGSDNYNDRLSERRISAVKNYLVTNGIPVANIKDEKAYGERNPLNENNSEEERSLNRRVEIEIINEVNTTTPTLKEKIADSAIVAGSNISLRNINFYGGMHEFLPESAPQLKELLDAMRAFPKLVIRIEGHICCQDGPGDGLDIQTDLRNLSESRARAIMDYLIASGINASRVSFKGFGHSKPIYPYPENTEEERILNRRVEIRIISK